MRPQAAAFATILAVIVDPRTSDDDLSQIVANDLREDAARNMLVALAAMHSVCIEEDAARAGITVDQMMQRVRQVIRDNTEHSERIAGGNR